MKIKYHSLSLSSLQLLFSLQLLTPAYTETNLTTTPSPLFHPTSPHYTNKIPKISHGEAYIEICFKKNGTDVDIHFEGGATTGGLCSPGESGFIIEKYQSLKSYWYEAKQACHEKGMRLPEPIEWTLACKNASQWSLSNINITWEWASNKLRALYIDTEAGQSKGLASPVFGQLGCNYMWWRWAAHVTGYSNEYAFRCAM